MNFSTQFFFLLIFALISCSKKENISFENSINQNDTVCLNEIKQAKSDIQNNKLVYCHYVGNIILNDLRGEKEMKILLSKYKIDFKNEGSPCVVEPNKIYNCYCEIMQEKITEKFGKKFIQKLLNKSDSLWTLKNLDKTFKTNGIYGTFDKCALFPNDKYYNETNHSGLQTVFDKKVNYPNNYKKKSHQYSNATIDATVFIDKNGIADVKDINTNYFDYKTKNQTLNKEFEKYFTELAKEIIENNKWTPAKIKGINVNSQIDLWIYLK